MKLQPIPNPNNSLAQCHRNYIEVNKFNNMLEIDILRNSSQKLLGVLRVDFGGFGCPNDAQTTCWLRLNGVPWKNHQLTPTYILFKEGHWDQGCVDLKPKPS